MTQAHAADPPRDPASPSRAPVREMTGAAAHRPSAESDAIHALVLDQLDEDQAQDVVTIALGGKSSIADHMVIASGRSTRQVAAMAGKLAERLKAGGHGSPRIEGLPAADWVLIDAGDVVVHLFRPEVRSFYNLERMWGFGDESAAAGTA